MSIPRYLCPKCGEVEYCLDLSGAPREPSLTLKVMQRWHARKCDGLPVYQAGWLPQRLIVGQEEG